MEFWRGTMLQQYAYQYYFMVCNFIIYVEDDSSHSGKTVQKYYTSRYYSVGNSYSISEDIKFSSEPIWMNWCFVVWQVSKSPCVYQPLKVTLKQCTECATHSATAFFFLNYSSIKAAQLPLLKYTVHSKAQQVKSPWRTNAPISVNWIHWDGSCYSYSKLYVDS